jgi:uncharacterized protein YkwD
MRKTHLLATFGAFIALAAAAPAGAGVTAAEHALLQEMNQARAAHGLRPLTLDVTLQRAARAHSLDMLRRDYFAHGPFASRILRFGVRGPIVGENLAWGVGTRGEARGVVAGWLNSPLHRRNLLRPGFRRVGVASLVGSFRGAEGARVVTANFAGT